MHLSALPRFANRPIVAVVAVLLGLAVGLSQSPHVRLLKPIGDLYLAVLQICVLPFLLATIPLALKSALANRNDFKSVGRVVVCLLFSLTIVMLTTVAVSRAVLKFHPLSDDVRNQLGTLLGTASSNVDIELSLRPGDGGLVPESNVNPASVVPTNIFSALTLNDSLKVVVFSIVFGLGLTATESQTGESAYGALRHVQRACILLFEWFNVGMPLGVISLIAPQIAQLGPQTYAVLAPLALAFLASTCAIILFAIICIALSLKLSPLKAVSGLSQPLALGAATRNTILCIPSAMTAMTGNLKASRDTCDLFIPIGFAILRFGNVVHFMTATIFIGYLLERPFSLVDFVAMSAFALMASFATIGISGVAGLAPAAAVMRPFGLSYELALPLLIVLDPVASMARAMINIAVGCQIVATAGGRDNSPI